MSRLVWLLLALPLLLGFDFPGGLQRTWRQADRAFRQKKYDEAEKLYNEARRQRPEDWRLYFNVTATQAAAKQYEQAAAGFQKIAAGGPVELRQAAEYNAGNCHFARQDTKQAIEHYKRALYLKPDDLNAKWNLELAKREQKKQEQQQKQQQQQQKQQQQQQKQDQDKHKQQEQQKQQQQQQQQQKQMDKEEARRLLQSLSQADRDLQKRMAREKKERGGEARPDRDW